MSNNRINEYVYLLKLSRDFLGESIDEYNSARGKEVELSQYHCLYYQRKYHAFAYSQLMYALYERLKCEVSSGQKAETIKQFFKKNKTSAVRKVCSLFANKVKHAKGKQSVNISPSQNLEISISTEEITVGPEKLTLTLVEDSQRIHPDLRSADVLELIKKSYDELLQFLEEEGYEY